MTTRTRPIQRPNLARLTIRPTRRRDPGQDRPSGIFVRFAA